jgi:hypothetical protein
MSTVSYEDLLMDRTYKQYYAKGLLLRTAEFISFCEGKADEDRINEFITTIRGKQLATKVNYLAVYQIPVVAWQDESDKQRNQLSFRVDLSASKESIMAAVKLKLDQYHSSKTEHKIKPWKLDALIEDFCFYDSVLLHGGNIESAMHEFYPESIGEHTSENPSVNKIYQMLRRIYLRIKRDIPSI